MKDSLSSRLTEILNSLPICKGIRILEIGCGPGVLARAIAKQIGEGHILAIDRSSKAIKMAIKNSQDEIASGRLSFKEVAIENFELEEGEQPYDIAFAIRVGALDGRYPQTGNLAFPKIRKALTKKGKLFVDGGNPLREIPLASYH